MNPFGAMALTGGLQTGFGIIDGLTSYGVAQQQSKNRDLDNVGYSDYRWNSQNIDYLRQKERDNWSAQQAQIQRDWEERMSNTAYQRASQDMQKAGFNPALLVSQGSASTPSGAYTSSHGGGVNRPVAIPGLSQLVSGMTSEIIRSATALAVAQERTFSNHEVAMTKAISNESIADKYIDSYDYYRGQPYPRRYR